MTTTTEVKNMRGDETVAELRELAKVLFAQARAERKARQEHMRYQLWWTSSDQQSEVPMGSYRRLIDAQDALPAAKDELLQECLSDHEGHGPEMMTRQACLDGTWKITCDAHSDLGNAEY